MEKVLTKKIGPLAEEPVEGGMFVSRAQRIYRREWHRAL